MSERPSGATPFAGNERFELRDRLGAGGMGVVFAAFDREREVVVALKTLHHTGDPQALLRFKREFRSLADVSHPNLVRLYELIAEADRWFFTMELLDATDFVSWVRGEEAPPPSALAGSSAPTTAVTTPALYDYVEPAPPAVMRGGAVDYDRLRDGLRGLVAGLSALHRSGHLHRDVKPSNILVTPEGRVVVVDFGVISEMTASSSEIIGTPAYMAPEQTTGEAQAASDWYAVGAVMYEAITGRRPFLGSRSAILEAKRHWDPLRPRLALADVPPELDSLCMRLLARNPMARPDGAEILAMLGGRPRRRRLKTLSDEGAPFYGRERELAVLTGALAAVGDGTPAIVDIYGESGMGKTALVRHFISEIERDGIAVIAGRCYENETVPHKAIDSVVDAVADLVTEIPDDEQRALIPEHAADLARMFPVLRQIPAIGELEADDADQAEVRRRARLALRDLFARLARRGRVVVFIDDLHWGDVESAPMIDAITRPPEAPGLLLVTTARSASRHRSPLLKALRRRRRRLGSHLALREIEVGLLDAGDARDLAIRLLGRDSEAPAIDRIVEESSGNPYLIGELARFAAARSSALGDVEAPTLDAMIGGRIDELDESESRLLAILAVAGRPLRQSVARTAAGIDRPAWHGLIHEMRHKQLVRVSGFSDDDSVEPYHDRIRETASRDIAGEALAAHHRALAAALEEDGSGEPRELALHHAAAGDDERAVHYALAAAERASAILAFDQAAAMWQLAIDRGGERPEWLAGRARALVDAGRGHEAAESFVAAAERSEGLEAIELDRQAAEQYLRSGHIDRGLEVLAAVLDAVGVKLPPTPRAAIWGFVWYRGRIWLRGLDHVERPAADIDARELVKIDVCLSACIGLALIDVARAAAFAQRTLLYALEAGEPHRLAYAMAMAAGFASGGGDDGYTDALYERASAIAETVDDTHLSAFIDVVRGVIIYERGDFSGFLEIAAACERVLRDRCRGVAWELRTMELLASSSLFFLGRLDELVSNIPRWKSSARDRGDRYAITNIHALAMPIASLMKGAGHEVLEELATAERAWTYDGVSLQRVFLHYSNTVLALYNGDTAAAHQRVTDGDPDVRRALLLRDRAVGSFWRFLRSSAALADVANGADGARRARRRARRDARTLLRSIAPCYRAMGAALEAAIAHQRADEARARRALESAIELFDEAGFVLYRDCARYQLGVISGDDELVESSRAALAKRVVEPERIAAALVCGFAIQGAEPPKARHLAT